ncbi:hypothetical protein SEA_CULVER_16 [Gordonia phage Culver]|nr:hypothetical protein SEA_CULVER_16 [Gordonia phage Culver]
MLQRYEWSEVIGELADMGQSTGYRSEDGPVLVTLVDRPHTSYSDEIAMVFHVVSPSGTGRHYKVTGYRDSYVDDFNVDSVHEVVGKPITKYEWEISE